MTPVKNPTNSDQPQSGVVDVVDKVTAAPGWVSDQADKANNRMISIARDLQAALDASAGVAEENLKQNKIESIGRRVANWLSNPVNLAIATAGAVFTFLGAVWLAKKWS